MCGQFELPLQGLAEWETEIDRKYASLPLPAPWRRKGTAQPGDILPVLARGTSGNAGPFLMRWGYRQDNKGRLLINARSETAYRKPLFSSSFENRRCLIPAASYYEWQRTGKGRQKFALTPQGAGDHRYLACLYRYENDPRLPAFVVLTRAAEPDIAFIHNRMPVLLDEDAAQAWLSPTVDPQTILSRALTVMDAASQLDPNAPLPDIWEE
ncbi:MAG: SOS response-associated peptidase [Clostridia bacterium]|nr:SOS response-associated peptidase [Clostridia bacterium]